MVLLGKTQVCALGLVFIAIHTQQVQSLLYILFPCQTYSFSLTSLCCTLLGC